MGVKKVCLRGGWSLGVFICLVKIKAYIISFSHGFHKNSIFESGNVKIAKLQQKIEH